MDCSSRAIRLTPVLMILPEGHYKETHEPRIRSGRERWIFGVCGVLAAILVAVTLFSLTSHQAANGHGCLDFNYTMAMGGEELHSCGQAAKRLCASPPHLGQLADDFATQLRDACHEAKFPYATAS
jgi:hypothetical protein